MIPFMPAAAQIKALLAPQDYYRRERAADFKSEYFAGEVFAMAGGSVNHSLIKANVVRALGNALARKGGGCRTFDSDLRVKIPQTGLRTYPDVSVICGPVTLDEEDEAGETVTNPTVIVEVLSDSTERYDRGTKFDHYQSIPSLKQYVLVSQDQARVETFLRQEEGTWQYVSFTGMEAVATLAALAIPLPLAEVFAGVEFPASPPLRLLPKA